MTKQSLFTIGHSNQSLEELIALLKDYQITALADVRSQPYSRYLSHFNQPNLKLALMEAKIQYVFLGKELGGRPTAEDCYVNGQADYEKMAKTEVFREGVQRLLAGLEQYRIALMCAEKDPLDCHRCLLVCRYLKDYHLEIKHILKSGEIESQEALENRLLKQNGLHDDHSQQLSLFETLPASQSSPEERLGEAYRLQSKKAAYQEK